MVGKPPFPAVFILAGDHKHEFVVASNSAFKVVLASSALAKLSKTPFPSLLMHKAETHEPTALRGGILRSGLRDGKERPGVRKF